MNIHAIYIDEFPPFKECTINLDSRFDYSVIPNKSASSLFQIERVENQEKFDVFQGYNCRVTGITGKNGAGKSTIGLLLKNIFSGKPIISKDNKTLIIYEVDEKLYLDEYKPDSKYTSYAFETPITVISASLKEEIHNLSQPDSIHRSKEWKKVDKKIVFYSSILSDINDFYYSHEDIINLSLDYGLRKFVENKRGREKKEDVFGFSNLVNDFFQDQSHDFMRLIFKMKREFPNDSFFTKIIDLPDEIDYYANIEIGREVWKKLNIEIPEDKELPFITKLYLTRKPNAENIHNAIADQLKALSVYSTLHILRNLREVDKLKAMSELVLSDDFTNMSQFASLNDSLEDLFQKIDETVAAVKFRIETSFFTTISTKCDDSAEQLFDLIASINNRLGVDFISYNMKRRLSSGERVVLNLFSSLEREREKLKGTNPIIFMDEIDQNLHPEWQRSIVYQLLKYFKSRNIANAHLIFTTHSPFVVSEIPNNHLKTRFDNQFRSIKGEMTFAGNISNVLYDVMNVESFNGKFTHEIINDALNYLNGQKSDRFSMDEQIRELIELIGEPLLSHHLEQMLVFKNNNK